MKRVIKPFTVEVRTSGRQAWAPSLQQPQPEVVEEPVGRTPEPIEAPRTAVVPTGRILPALDEPAIPARQEKPRGQRKVRSDAGKPRANTAQTAEPVIEAGLPVVALPTIEPVSIRFPRLPRSAFPLGEQWKARLPTVALSDGDVLSPGWRRMRLRKPSA